MCLVCAIVISNKAFQWFLDCFASLAMTLEQFGKCELGNCHSSLRKNQPGFVRRDVLKQSETTIRLCIIVGRM